jgi:hypothetical protein
MYYMQATKSGRKANMYDIPSKESKDITLDYLTEHKKNLLTRRERLMLPLQEVDQEIEHVTATIRSLQKPPQPASFTATLVVDFPIGKLRKLTQVQALTVIAKHYGGTFKAQEAKRLLIKAGVMRETKNSTNVIHAVIIRSEKFERVRPGEYRLKSEPQEQGVLNGGPQGVLTNPPGRLTN